MNRFCKATLIAAMSVSLLHVSTYVRQWFSHCQSSGTTICVTPVDVLDGRTFDARIPGEDGLVRVRLSGIEVPLEGAWRQRSREHLRRILSFRPIHLEVQSIDSFGLAEAHVYAGRQRSWVQGMMVAAGCAWCPEHAAPDEQLLGLQRLARAKRVGLWAAETELADLSSHWSTGALPKLTTPLP